MLSQFNISPIYRKSQYNNALVLYSLNTYGLYVDLIKQTNGLLFLGFRVALYLGYSVTLLLDIAFRLKDGCICVILARILNAHC